MYQKLSTDGNSTTVAKDLPSSVRVKLYQQHHLGKVQPVTDSLINSAEKDTLPEALIIDSVKTVDKPTVKSILDKIRESKNAVSWTKNFEIVLNGNVIPNTNIVKIMQYLMKSKVVTNEKDVPTATSEFYQALIDQVNIPKAWIKQKPRLRVGQRWQPYY